MISITIDREKIADVKQFKQILYGELLTAYYKATLAIQGNVQRDISNKKVTATGMLMNSITALQPSIVGNKITGGVFSSLPYAIPVNYGSKPHFPPVKPLKDWVKIKFRINYGQQNTGIAWAIARKINQKGTKPKNFFEDGLEKSMPQVEKIFNEAIAISITKVDK